MRTYIILILVAAVEMTLAAERQLPDAAWNQLPRWRGFNLLEKFNLGQNEPFREEDFRLIAELGFNFVRLPMDYRCWIAEGDWNRLREDTFKEIDQAVEYGKRYGIHVDLNFHRAPGYTVANPPEAKSLWTDPEAQEVCAMHWRIFAKRYKGVPNRNLSFNLINEPAGVEPAGHAAVIAKLAAAIRAEDPERLIICDLLPWGTVPGDELLPLKVALSTRGYMPMEVTHYKASWVQLNDSARPAWPMLHASGWLAGPSRADQGGPLSIEGPFDGITALRIRVLEVSSRSRLVVKADARTIFDHLFQCGSGTGEWKTAVYRPQWNDYQNIYERDYEAPIPSGTRELVLENAEGDWMTLGAIGLRSAGGEEHVAVLTPGYGRPPPAIQFRPVEGGEAPFRVSGPSGREWLAERWIAPLRALQAKGVGVMVGEFGAFNKTPHTIVLRWMRDNLTNWKDADWGWALWNFRGPFGVLDSERDDVAYEEFRGHKLDRKMLDLLQGN